jgi:peptidoglycan/LPS O-acetylase OafA/YrhL
LVVKAALTIATVLAALTPLVTIQSLISIFRRTSPSFVYIGSISYAIYAIHVPVIALTTYFLPSVWAGFKIVIFCVVTLVISHVLERVVQPLFSGSRPHAPAC